MSIREDIESVKEDIKLYKELSGEDGSQETIATIGAYLRGYRQGKEDAEPHWIPVEQALPEEPFGCLVTVMDTNPVTMEEFENILPYFVGWDGEQWNDGDGQQCPFEVLAWWELPEPYKGVTE